MLTHTFKIEKNVPLSEAAQRKYKRWPFAEMKIGDSFYLSLKDAGQNGVVVRPAASYFGIRNRDYKFTVRKDGEGYRVWRIAVT